MDPNWRHSSFDHNLHHPERVQIITIREKKFAVLTEMSMKSSIFWDVTPCRLMEVSEGLMDLLSGSSVLK
jgi:hypothetical protein